MARDLDLVVATRSALALVLDGDELPVGAGVPTPATVLGLRVVERLHAAVVGLTVQRSCSP